LGQAIGEKEKKSMSNDDLYSDNFEGVIGNPVRDFLPRPANLIKKKKMQRVTMEVPSDVLSFFKEQAREHGGSYQGMIRELLSHYVKIQQNFPNPPRS
jgi:predicted DNA binding CopG/RHH family protein